MFPIKCYAPKRRTVFIDTAFCERVSTQCVCTQFNDSINITCNAVKAGRDSQRSFFCDTVCL